MTISFLVAALAVLFISAAPRSSASTDVALLSSPAFIPCDCDLNSLCDPACCCDADCAGQSCSSNSLSSALDGATRSCVGSVVGMSLWASNALGMSAANASSICVVHSNSPAQGDFFASTPSLLGDASSFKAAVGDPLLVQSPSIASTASYFPGDIIVTSSDSNLGIPSALSTGLIGSTSTQCADAMPIHFLAPTTSTCTRDLSALSSLCAANASLDLGMYLKQLAAVTVAPANSSSSSLSPMSKVPVTVNAPWSCPSSGSSPCSMSLTTAPPTLNASSLICSNIVSHLHISIYYQNAGIIGENGLNLTRIVVNWAAENWDPSIFVNPVFAQTFGVAWVAESSNKNTTSSSNATTITTWRSGNPGYQPGLPALFLARTSASLPATPSALLLPAPDTVTGQCTSGSMGSMSAVTAVNGTLTASPFAGYRTGLLGSATIWGGVAVRYATDTSTHCLVPIAGTAQQLTAGTTACTVIQTWASATLDALTHVGVFGNATVDTAASNTNTTSTQWTPIVRVAAALPLAASQYACPVSTVYQIDVAWGDTGPASAPQPAILGMRVASGRVVDAAAAAARLETASASQWGGSTAAVRRGVPVSVRVRWIRVSPESVELATWYPPAPRLFPPLPRDWLYPFE
ncbi:hypothetical protein BC828DRAFT_66442 [Blastocladiella britannica]|nr:hypothetical protein BC828DRAFT_66442 [Blastocladiella britannica]